MNLKAWKYGLIVALITGLLTGLAAYEVADKINLTKFAFFILGCVAKDALLWLKEHPIEKAIQLPLLALAVLIFGAGCSSFSTTQTDLSYDAQGKPQRTITTRVTARTFWDSTSNLAKFSATQTDKSQSANVGSLQAQATSTNSLAALKELRGIVEALPK